MFYMFYIILSDWLDYLSRHASSLCFSYEQFYLWLAAVVIKSDITDVDGLHTALRSRFL